MIKMHCMRALNHMTYIKEKLLRKVTSIKYFAIKSSIKIVLDRI